MNSTVFSKKKVLDTLLGKENKTKKNKIPKDSVVRQSKNLECNTAFTACYLFLLYPAI